MGNIKNEFLPVEMIMVCRECNRKFDLTNDTDAQEFYFGHDCEN